MCCRRHDLILRTMAPDCCPDYGNKRIREIVCTTTDCDSATVTTIKTFTDSKPTGVAVCPDQLYLIVGVVHETSGAGVFKRLDLSSQPPPDETIAGSDFATRDGDGTCAAMKSLGQFAIEPSGMKSCPGPFEKHCTENTGVLQAGQPCSANLVLTKFGSFSSPRRTKLRR